MREFNFPLILQKEHAWQLPLLFEVVSNFVRFSRCRGNVLGTREKRADTRNLQYTRPLPCIHTHTRARRGWSGLRRLGLHWLFAGLDTGLYAGAGPEPPGLQIQRYFKIINSGDKRSQWKMTQAEYRDSGTTSSMDTQNSDLDELFAEDNINQFLSTLCLVWLYHKCVEFVMWT